MSNKEIVGEFINKLQFILEDNIYDLDSQTKGDIKADAHEALSVILQKYKIID